MFGSQDLNKSKRNLQNHTHSQSKFNDGQDSMDQHDFDLSESNFSMSKRSGLAGLDNTRGIRNVSIT